LSRSLDWVLVCWWWRFDWSFARLIAPVVATTAIILSSIKILRGHILVLANPGPPGRVKVKVKVHTLDIAPLRSESPLRSPQVWHTFSRDFTVLPAHPHVHPQSV